MLMKFKWFLIWECRSIYWRLPKRGRRNINRYACTLRYHAERLPTVLRPFPVYYEVDSRDCDHVRGVSAHRAATGYHYLKQRDAEYEYAEGPTFVTRITKHEYDTFEAWSRDYLTEAYEDGHPHSPRY